MKLFNKLVVLVSVASMPFFALANTAKAEQVKGYQTLAQAQPTDTKGKIEVIEFFFYSCPHCKMLDPFLTTWVKKQGNAIAFKRVPVDFGQGQTALRKMYYTLEEMGELEKFHSRVFEAIHVQHLPFSTDQQVLAILKKNGIDEKKYLEMSTSFGVGTKIKRAEKLQSAYNIESVPTIFVDGRYMTSPALVMGSDTKMTEAAGDQAMIQVLDALVVKAEKANKLKK